MATPKPRAPRAPKAQAAAPMNLEPKAPAAPKPKAQRTKGWQFELPANGTTDPSTLFRSMATDPAVQYLAHTVDPVSGNLRGVVQFNKPKTSKAFQSGQWQAANVRSTPLRVTSSTTPELLGNRVWAYGSLSSGGGRVPRQSGKQQQNQEQQHYEEEYEDDDVPLY